MPDNADVYGTGRMLSPIMSPDGTAAVIYRDNDVTIWLYRQMGTVRVQSMLLDPSQGAIVKERVKAKLQQAIRESQSRIEQAQKVVSNNERDIHGYSAAILELEKVWPDEEGFDE